MVQVLACQWLSHLMVRTYQEVNGLIKLELVWRSK